MKSLTSLWSCMANELAMRCCTSATNDINTVVRRVEHEGLSFLAITLANYGKVIEKWLDHGFVAPWECSSFKKNSLTGLPVFLQGFLGRVFDPASGVLLNDPDIEAIYALRQLTLTFSKIALPTDPSDGAGTRSVVTPRRERLAMSEFIQCEKDVRRSDRFLDPLYLEEFQEMAGLLFNDVFAKMDRDVHFARLVGKHGPGSVADRFSSNAKWDMRTWTTRLHQMFPSEEFLIPNQKPEWVDDLRNSIDVLEPGAEIPVKVITVPKTLKSPRIIAIEPAAMQYAQQSLFDSYVSAIKEDSFLNRVIGTTDQGPNRVLAREGSHTGDLATLDLSEASDRVSYEHVRAMLVDFPELLWAVDACRSRKARVPGHGVIRLAKFASMGSALCFPMESMVFLTLVFLGIKRELNTSLDRDQLIELFSDRVRVFGDDLIVPKEHVLSVVDELSLFGHRVNIGKSFWIGRFRESCGREYYDGHDVSIVKVRQILPTRRQDASGVIAAVSLRNQLYWAGLWQSAKWMDNFISGILPYFPNVAPSSPLLGRESALGYQFQRLHPEYHSPLAKGYYVVSVSPRDKLEGSGALLKCLSRKSIQKLALKRLDNGGPDLDVASVDAEHLERSGRPERVNIKLGWRSPH